MKFEYSTDLTYEALRQENVSTFLVHSTDSIFFQLSNSAQILLTDSLGKGISLYETSADHKFIFPAFLPYHQGYYDKGTRNFYTTIIPVGFFNSVTKAFDDANFQGVYNLDSTHWIKFYGPLEGVMKAKVDSFYPPELSVPYNLLLHDKAYVTYPVDHFVYVYDIASGRLLDKRPTVGKLKIDLPEPLASEFVDSRQRIFNFPIENSFYEPLFYHKDTGLLRGPFTCRRTSKHRMASSTQEPQGKRL